MAGASGGCRGIGRKTCRKVRPCLDGKVKLQHGAATSVEVPRLTFLPWPASQWSLDAAQESPMNSAELASLLDQ